jgi:hypothetical protein
MRSAIGPHADIIRSIAGPQSSIAPAIPSQHEAKSGFGVSSAPVFRWFSWAMIALLRSELTHSVHP